MITSVFSKSKPINFVIIAVYVTIIFLLTNYNLLFSDFNGVLITLPKWIITLFLFFLLDFIVSKNNLSQRNSYAIMTFGLLFGMFPEAMKNFNLLWSNLFVILALRRLMSLHSKVNIKKKFFDAAFWIALAALFYFWAIFFFALVIVALIYYSQNDFKHIIIPFVGIATVFLLSVIYNIITHDVYLRPSDFERYSSLDYTAYNNKESILKFTVFFTAFIWTLIYYFRTLPDKNKKLKPSYYIIAWASVIAIFIAFIAPIKNSSEYLFLFVPFSIIMGRYIEVVTEHWFKQVFVALLLLTPIVSLLL